MTEIDDQISQRRAGFESVKRRPGVRALGITAGVVVFAVMAAFVIMPEKIAKLMGWGTSKVEEIQTSRPDDFGISTDFRTASQVDTDPAVAAIDVPTLTETPTAPNERDQRLARVEELLERLSSAEGGVNREELANLLAEQERALKAEFERQREADRLARDQEMKIMQAGLVPSIDPDAAAKEAERQRREEERARRIAINNEQVASNGLVIDGGAAASGGSGSSGGGGREPTVSESFMNEASTRDWKTVRATSLAKPSRTIVQGTMLAAILETAINTDLPGALRAITTEDIYAFDGSKVLMPRGTRLIGTYSSQIELAQERVMVAWNRAITPEGRTVSLGGYGSDTLGQAGQAGEVDTHFMQRFGTAALISIIGAAPNALIAEDNDGNTIKIANDIGNDMQNTTSSVMEDYLRIPPTIYVDQGTEIRVFVNQDLIF